MDDRRQPDLDDESRRGDGEADLCQKLRHGVAAPQLLRRHVHLLIDEGGAQRAEGDHQRDELYLPRLRQQGDRPLDGDAFFFPNASRFDRAAGRFLSFENHPDEHRAEAQRARAPEQHRIRADGVHDERRQCRAGHATQRDATAHEPEQSLGLPRIVDAVCERPELTDEQDADDGAPNVERDRDPALLRPEQRPERNHDAGHAGLNDRERPATRKHREQPRIAKHQDANQQPVGEDDVGNIDRAETVDQLRSRQWLDDVVGGHRQSTRTRTS